MGSNDSPTRTVIPSKFLRRNLQSNSSNKEKDTCPVEDSSTSDPAPGSSNADNGCFDCNICLDLPQDPVITVCGHLFCWPCLYKWLKVHDSPKECPVCKAGVEESKVIPLYGRGNTKKEDPRKKPIPDSDIPTRPQGQRPPRATTNGNFGSFFNPGTQGNNSFGQFGNVNVGFGLFPGLFGFQFQFPATVGSQALTPEQQQQSQLSRMLLLVGSFVILCLIFF